MAARSNEKLIAARDKFILDVNKLIRDFKEETGLQIIELEENIIKSGRGFMTFSISGIKVDPFTE